jgi:hypothetical protein
MNVKNNSSIKVGILLILILLSGISACHKIIGGVVPEWFIKKFSGSAIDIIPGGISFSFYIITMLETIIPLFLIMALIKKEFNGKSSTFSELGFKLSGLLFIILFFGSFLVESYDNGFNDFVYFVTIIYLRREYYKLN